MLFNIKKRIAASFLFIGLAFLLVLLEAQPALAIPTFQNAPSITLDRDSGAPGSQVVVQGRDFPTLGGGDIKLHWDSQQSPLIGSGPGLNQDGTFTAIATIPPNAAEGDHTIFAVDWATLSVASATFTVVGNRLEAVYIYDFELSKANDFETLLERDGMLDVTLLQLDNVATADFSPYDLIIIGIDTGGWGDGEAIAGVRDSGQPILGLGDGGYAFFGQMSLDIGSPYGRSATTRRIRPVDLFHPIYQTPYGFSSVLIDVYNSDIGAIEIYLSSPPPGVFALGRSMASDNHYSLVQQAGRYFLWGFNWGPADMTTHGERLFVNVAWYLLRVRLGVDTLILTDYQRMKGIGYSATSVNTLESKINTLVGKPWWESNMAAVVKRLDLDTPDTLRATRAGWDYNEDNLLGTNTYVREIEGYIEKLKRGSYPNLQYVIFVGAHEVIPMKVRKVETTSPLYESKWAEGLPQKSGYLYMLYHNTSGGASRGRYLTDSVYGDLSYVDNGHGADNELIPELAVGRLVETPGQISKLLDNYMSSKGVLSRSNMAAIGSWDGKDAAQRAANYMGASADTALIQDEFSSTLVPPKINTKNDIVYIGAHSDYNLAVTQYNKSLGFMAGSDANQGDTEELNNIPDAVIVSDGCHSGVNLGNKRYHDYDNTTKYGDFPERFANRGVGIYLGGTGFTWSTATMTDTNPARAGATEVLTSDFVKHLLRDGSWTTAGKAFKAAVDDYAATYGGDYSSAVEHRRVLAIATLYGIPNYRWPTGYYTPVPWRPFGCWLEARWIIWPSASGVQAMAAAKEEVALEITNWSVDPNGLIDIAGASYTGNDGEPLLPMVHTSRVLPVDSNVVKITWNQAESQSTTISNDVPLVNEGIGSQSMSMPILKPFSSNGFYPPTPYYSTAVSTLGGGAIEVGLSIVPVQYDQSTHQTRIWTKMAFELEYEVDQDALSRDSDSDGLPDYWESAYGLSPNEASGDDGASGDPDLDGLNNEQEYNLGTDPLDPDSDHDGVNDGLEVDKGTDPLNPGSRSGDAYLPAVTRSYTGTVSSH